MNVVAFVIKLFKCIYVFYLVGHTQTKKTQTPKRLKPIIQTKKCETEKF